MEHRRWNKNIGRRRWNKNTAGAAGDAPRSLACAAATSTITAADLFTPTTQTPAAEFTASSACERHGKLAETYNHIPGAQRRSVFVDCLRVVQSSIAAHTTIISECISQVFGQIARVPRCTAVDRSAALVAIQPQGLPRVCT